MAVTLSRPILLALAITALVTMVTAGIILGVKAQDRDAILLDGSLSPATVVPGETIHLTITVRNILPLSNEPPRLNTWLGMISYGVLTGNLTAQNAQNAFWDSGLAITWPIWFCTLGGGTDDFGSNSQRLQPFQTITRNIDFSGYYGSTPSPCKHEQFSPGVYTLFVEDAWNHTITRYFTVVSS